MNQQDFLEKTRQLEKLFFDYFSEQRFRSYGIKLDAGTTQRLTLRIRDNASVPNVFDCIAYGFDRFE